MAAAAPTPSALIPTPRMPYTAAVQGTYYEGGIL